MWCTPLKFWCQHDVKHAEHIWKYSDSTLKHEVISKFPSIYCPPVSKFPIGILETIPYIKITSTQFQETVEFNMIGSCKDGSFTQQPGLFFAVERWRCWKLLGILWETMESESWIWLNFWLVHHEHIMFIWRFNDVSYVSHDIWGYQKIWVNACFKPLKSPQWRAPVNVGRASLVNFGSLSQKITGAFTIWLFNIAMENPL